MNKSLIKEEYQNGNKTKPKYLPFFDKTKNLQKCLTERKNYYNNINLKNDEDALFISLMALNML